jgi:hypothetical protein
MVLVLVKELPSYTPKELKYLVLKESDRGSEARGDGRISLVKEGSLSNLLEQLGQFCKTN